MRQFRNHAELSLTFSPHVNIITGKNGAGKTNILEAISVLSTTKSFRSVHDKNMIQLKSDYYFCKGTVNNHQKESQYSIGYTRSNGKGTRKLIIDSNEITRVSDYYGNFITTVFSPDDIFLIKGGPDGRRRYFDSVLSKVNKRYYLLLSEYKQVLASRNQVLKDVHQSIRNESELDIWDDILSEKGYSIVSHRNRFIEKFSSFFNEYYIKTGITGDECSVKYVTDENNKTRDSFLQNLKKKRKRDIIFGSTSTGPHRDDYTIVNGQGELFEKYASQGQMRTVTVALKIAEKEYIKSTSGEEPVLLIDDIFSEFDRDRKRSILESMLDNNQIFITMVSLHDIMSNFPSYSHFNIDDRGSVIINEV
jgi:DNA replication and repair protein RecF